jgi:glycosyltransferase involved in cell wall biosynthesis
MKISGLIITLNEEENIADAINSLKKICDDIIVVDSLSSDKTVEIARSLGVKVYLQEYLGDGAQRTHGLPYCDHDWVFNLDADERLDDDLVEEVKSLDLENSSFEAYDFRRKNIFHDKFISVTNWYPDHIRRLFNKTKTDFAHTPGHTKIKTKNYKVLNSHVIHYSFKDYHEIIHMANKYSTRYALNNSDKKVSVLSPITHGFVAFIKNYIIKRGFMAGFDGFHISLWNALGSYMKYLKIIELQRLNKK